MDIISSSSSVLIKFIPFSSNVWSITSARFWWYDIYPLVFSYIISSLIILLDSVSVYFCKEMSLFNELLVWTLIWGRFEFIFTLSLFDVFKWFVSLLLKCELTAIHIIFLDSNETFLPCFSLCDAKTMAIYFTSEKYCLITIKIKPEIWEDIQYHDHRELIDCVINTTIDWIVFIQ